MAADLTLPLAEARAAVDAGCWDAAITLLRQEPETLAGSPEGQELLAAAAYGAGDLETTLGSWERAYTLRAQAGDQIGAASAAVMLAMFLMMDTGLMAPVRGWLKRAEALLADRDEQAVHAWLAMVRAYERFMCGDMAAAGSWGQRAVDLGTRFAVAPPVAIGRVANARVRVFEGDVDGGLAELDEVALICASGALDPLTTGMVYCELICAMQGLAQYDRADEWTEAMERWRPGAAFGGINGRCRVHRAEMLRLHGPLDDAETEALRACDELRPWMRRELGWPLTELGNIRLRRGDLAGAEAAFLAAHEHAWSPQPGLALLRLAQGDATGAAALIRDALEHPFDIPSKERPPHGSLRRAPLLDAQVEIAIAANDLGTAAAAAIELTEIADSFRSRGLVAAAALATGRVARLRGDTAEAVRACARSVVDWVELGAPYEAAIARLELAHAYEDAGNVDAATLEAQAAQLALDRLGAKPTPRAETPREQASSKTGEECVFRRTGDTRSITFAGTSVGLRDLVGFRYLARLLSTPGREVHVLDLVAVERGSLPTGGFQGERELRAPAGSDLLLDEEARRSYRRRLAEVEEDIDEARRMNDPERAALAEVDRDYLLRELARATGLGGRGRRFGDTSERARTSVTRALHYALDRIAEHHEALAAHLSRTVRTGTYCAYEPDPRAPISWET